jgi:hypothetical protein
VKPISTIQPGEWAMCCHWELGADADMLDGCAGWGFKVMQARKIVPY